MMHFFHLPPHWGGEWRELLMIWINGNPSLKHSVFISRSPNEFGNGSWTSTYWPLYSSYNKEYLSLNIHNKTTGHGVRSRKCAFWKTYLPSLLSMSSMDLSTFIQCYQLWIFLTKLFSRCKMYSGHYYDEIASNTAFIRAMFFKQKKWYKTPI